MRPHHLAPLLLTVLAATAGTRAAPQRQELSSEWRTGAITVDGSASEWEGRTTAVADLSVSVGVANDAETLYVCLVVNDLQTRELMLRRGMIAWFDPSGGTKKVFGIRYPVGTFSVEKPRPSSRARAVARDAPRNATPEPIEIVNRVELYGPGRDERRSLLADRVPGIRLNISQSDTGMVYELEVPLVGKPGRPYGVHAKPGAPIGFGLETPDLEKGVTVTGDPPRGDAGSGGWSVGAGGGRAPESPPSRGQEREKAPKPIKWWGAVRLAVSGAPPSPGARPPGDRP